MGDDVLGFGEIDQTQVAIVGGKGAQLGELSRIEGIHVPAGFCITTDAFRRVMANAPSMAEQLDRLSHTSLDDRGALRSLSADIRRTIEQVAIPDDLGAAITRSVAHLGEHAAYAVRSSATTEDLPTASFAGQQDTYLNVVGSAALLQYVRRCWASLFTERAVTYRLQNGFDHRLAQMAVVIQQHGLPAGSRHSLHRRPRDVKPEGRMCRGQFRPRRGPGLRPGEPRHLPGASGEIVAKAVAAKVVAIEASPAGGTHEVAIEEVRQAVPALTDAQIIRLSRLGRQIEAHFGRPQDIEWCLDEDGFHIVQSRPITSLFPIPVAGDSENHVYVSVGHAQMMTDAMKPLGLSFWQMTTPRPMYEAGGRLFVDVAPAPGVASQPRRPSGGHSGRSDPLIGDALRAILERGDFIPTLPDQEPESDAGWWSALTPSGPTPLSSPSLSSAPRPPSPPWTETSARNPGRRWSTSSWPTSRN